MTARDEFAREILASVLEEFGRMTNRDKSNRCEP